jgi:predicted dinucleotide-binding enzyme
VKIAVLGTGPVGTMIASKLIELGHEVALGARSADNPTATAWAAGAGPSASNGTFARAAAGADLLVNATAGAHSVDALGAVSPADLSGKVLLDIANPLEFRQDGTVVLSVSNDDSLAETLQRAHPDLRVVKTLNTMSSYVMVDPAAVPGEHVVFVAGDDAEAKATATEVLGAFGWPAHRILDLGGLSSARATEAYLHLWLALWRSTGNAMINLQVNAGVMPPVEQPA